MWALVSSMIVSLLGGSAQVGAGFVEPPLQQHGPNAAVCRQEPVERCAENVGRGGDSGCPEYLNRISASPSGASAGLGSRAEAGATGMTPFAPITLSSVAFATAWIASFVIALFVASILVPGPERDIIGNGKRIRFRFNGLALFANRDGFGRARGGVGWRTGDTSATPVIAVHSSRGRCGRTRRQREDDGGRTRQQIWDEYCRTARFRIFPYIY